MAGWHGERDTQGLSTWEVVNKLKAFYHKARKEITMDEMEQQLNDLIRSTEPSNREYHGKCIDEDIEMLMDIEACLDHLDFEIQRWAILFLAYRWLDARVKPHDDSPGDGAPAGDTARWLENLLQSERVAPRDQALVLIAEHLEVVAQAGILLDRLDAIGQPWALRHLIYQWYETAEGLNEDTSEC